MSHTTVCVNVPNSEATLIIYAVCTYAGSKPTWGWDGGHPGDPPEWEIDSVHLDDAQETKVDPAWIRALGLTREVENKLAQEEPPQSEEDYY